jgi:hypothetical protein
MKAKRLNRAGRREFERMVEAMRSEQPTKAPIQILNDTYAVEDLPFELEVAEPGFKSRFEMGQHLVDILANVDRSEFLGDHGFWDWLALYWFDDFCPKKADGSRKKPSATPNYVMSEDYKRRYRHAVYVTWQLVEMHGDNAKFMLFKEPDVRGELTEQFMARQYYLSCGGVIRAAQRLYWDAEVGKLKKGAGSKSFGSSRRLVAWLQQIEVTYDLFSMDAEQLLELIPNEFKRFLK